MFIPSTFKRPVSSWQALNLRKTLLMASSVRLKPRDSSRLPCVDAQETLTFLLTQEKTGVNDDVHEERCNVEREKTCLRAPRSSAAVARSEQQTLAFLLT